MESRITLGDKSFKPYLPYEQIEAAIDKLAARMNEDYKSTTLPPIFLCVLNGAIMFTAEMMKRLNFPAELISIKMSSYCGTCSTGEVRIPLGLTGSVEGRDVIIFEDIVDTGVTITNLKKHLEEKGASSVRICTMLVKPEVYKQDTVLDYVAMEIPNAFIVGFGLDYNELGRNLKDIYVIDR